MHPATVSTPPEFNTQIALFILGGFCIGFPLLWCFVVWILSRASGWHRLALRYASGSRVPDGERHAGVSGMMGGVSYRGVLTLHFAGEGFFIEPMALFRIGQPRLFIPWADVAERSTGKVLWWRTARLTVGQPAITTITLPAELVERHAPPARS